MCPAFFGDEEPCGTLLGLRRRRVFPELGRIEAISMVVENKPPAMALPSPPQLALRSCGLSPTGSDGQVTASPAAGAR